MPIFASKSPTVRSMHRYLRKMSRLSMSQVVMCMRIVDTLDSIVDTGHGPYINTDNVVCGVVE